MNYLITQFTHRQRLIAAHVLFGIFALVLRSGSSLAQVLEPPFTNDYSVVDLGSVPGVPPNYGGLTFELNDPNTILIGGSANNAGGLLYEIPVVRGLDSHITGFNGTATVFAAAAYNDGGVVYGPSNVLFLARWNINEIGQTKFGSTNTDKIINLGSLSISTGPGGLNFVPPGFPGAGQLKMAAYSDYKWFTLHLAPDGAGTFDITNATYVTTIVGGPEGFIYVPPGSPQFTPFDSMLVCEYQAGIVSAYSIDGNGDPLTNSRTAFITGLTGAEGAVIDPRTGDFLFSTFGGGSHVVAVRGFVAPSADLAVTKTGSPDPVNAGSQLTYVVTVTNQGPGTATGVVLNDLLPTSAAYMSSLPSQGSCGLSNNELICTLGTLASGSTASVSILVTPSLAGIISNTASTAANEPDVNLTNNIVTITTTVAVAPSNSLPVAVCQSVTTNAGANCQTSLVALDFDGGSFDNGGNITGRSINPTGPFTKGVQQIILTVTDNNNASASCTTTVTVVDNTLPLLTCNDVTATAGPGQSNTVVHFTIPATDNCGSATVSCTVTSGATFNLGTNSVMCTAIDTSANTNTCNFNVIVNEAPPETHDLALIKMKAPKNINLQGAEASLTKFVKVTLQNRSPHNETITNFTSLITLVAESLSNVCPNATVVLHPGPPNNPKTLKPKQKLTVTFDVTWTCANDPLKGAGHEDFRYLATVHHSAIDGQPDTHTPDDVCPRAALPGGTDPNPDASKSLKDTGCAGGVDVKTDVFLKQ
jgi:uncharacterized repeat protein (TIGR01451 family)